jgi:hypothetical protein
LTNWWFDADILANSVVIRVKMTREGRVHLRNVEAGVAQYCG